jgi:hypothetical protein
MARHVADAEHPAAPFLLVWGPPKHSTETHTHDFKIVAEFTGRRAALEECACGDVHTIWRSEGDS